MMPPTVTTSSPFATPAISAFCSLARFCCGRIITKYMITNIGIMMNRKLLSPDEAAGAAVWA